MGLCSAVDESLTAVPDAQLSASRGELLVLIDNPIKRLLKPSSLWLKELFEKLAQELVRLVFCGDR
jgi:hypothetical protein